MAVETIKTYTGSNHPVKDCFLTLELLIDDVDTADTDEPYDVDGAVSSLNIVIATVEQQEKELTNYKLGFATQTEERERAEAENALLREPFRNVDAEDWRYIMTVLKDYQDYRAKFWVAVLIEQRDALAVRSQP